MFGNIFGEMFDVCFEVYLEDNVINKQQMQAPAQFLIMNFIQNAEQIGRDGRPIKLRMYREDTIWDKFEKKEKPPKRKKRRPPAFFASKVTEC